MGTCTAFVFAALVEFTFVNYTWRTKGRPSGLGSRHNIKHENGENGSKSRSSLINLEMVIDINFLIFGSHSLTCKMIQHFLGKPKK